SVDRGCMDGHRGAASRLRGRARRIGGDVAGRPAGRTRRQAGPHRGDPARAMNSTELKRRKREVRKRVLLLRDAIAPQERERLSRLVAERFLGLPEVTEARTILAFWSFGSEVSTEPLMDALHRRGARIALPRIAGADIELRVWVPGDEMTATVFGALEPANGDVLMPSEIDVVAAPGVAFD